MKPTKQNQDAARDAGQITLTIHRTTRIDDASGREITRFTPVFRPDVTATGELRFAFWEAWSAEAYTFQDMEAKALANARQCLQTFASV